MQDEFKVYQRQVLKNAKSFASDLQGLGFNIVTGGTDNHLMLVDLRNQGIDGAKLEKTLEAVNIASNKNTIPSDKSALTPSGIRFGTPAMTSRGLVEKDFEVVAKLVKEAADIANEVKAVNPNAKIGEFVKGLAGNKRVEQVRKEVEDFASKFPTIGF
jgi:glycine hydroxymethyltransferase